MSRDHTTALQPGRQSETLSLKTNKQKYLVETHFITCCMNTCIISWTLPLGLESLYQPPINELSYLPPEICLKPSTFHFVARRILARKSEYTIPVTQTSQGLSVQLLGWRTTLTLWFLSSFPATPYCSAMLNFQFSRAPCFPQHQRVFFVFVFVFPGVSLCHPAGSAVAGSWLTATSISWGSLASAS